MIDTIEQMTPRQSFALYLATKTDVRKLALTKGQASGFITRAQNDPVAVKNELIALGGIDKSNGKVLAKKLDYQAIFSEAHQAGMVAGNACKPTPMVVQQHQNMADDSSPVVKSYLVPSGICGFASSIIRPGNSGFAVWLRKNKIGHKHYYGGWAVPCMEFNQSMECKIAYCDAFGSVLAKHGINGGYTDSRMD